MEAKKQLIKIVILVLSFWLTIAEAQTVTVNVAANILKSFNSQSSGASKVEWFFENNMFEVYFKQGE